MSGTKLLLSFISSQLILVTPACVCQHLIEDLDFVAFLCVREVANLCRRLLCVTASTTLAFPAQHRRPPSPGCRRTSGPWRAVPCHIGGIETWTSRSPRNQRSLCCGLIKLISRPERPSSRALSSSCCKSTDSSASLVIVTSWSWCSKRSLCVEVHGTDAWADSRCHQLFTIQWPGRFALTQETLVCQNMSKDVTCRSGQWCLLIVIFCPAPKSKFFGQHFGMESPMQLFTACCIAIPSAWDRRAWRCMSIRAADRGEALVLRQICKIGGSVDVDCLVDGW